MTFRELALEFDPDFYRWDKRLRRKVWWRWAYIKYPVVQWLHDWTEDQGALCHEVNT